nr:MAK10-like protein [Tanacetum cinerariifolium]
MFQQHQGESLSEAWTRFKDLLQKVPHHGIDLWLQVQIFFDFVNPDTKRTIDQSVGAKLRDKSIEESWALLEDLSLYDNESWNDPRDFAKPVKVISLPQDVPSTSDCRLIELKNQVQCLMEAHISPNPPVQANKITSSCEICSSPHDTQYCMDNHGQAFVDYTSSRTDEAGESLELGKNGSPSFKIVKKAKIAVGEGVTRSIFAVKEINLCDEEVPYWTTLGKRESYEPRPSMDVISARTPYYAKKDFMDYHLPGDWEMARDAELNQFKDVLVVIRMVEFLGAIPINLNGNMWESEELVGKKIDWNKPPKEEDGVWYIRIELINPDGERLTRTFQLIPTTRKLSEKENPSEIIDLDHFHDF